MISRTLIIVIICVASMFAVAQDMSIPTPERIDIHSKILNEDRAVWVRLPPGYQQSKAVYPVLYHTDAPEYVNEIGALVDYLAVKDRTPEVIIVGIGNTDRTRDLTPTHSGMKSKDGTLVYPTSGGGDKFLDFIQSELIPEIEKRYRTAPYRIFGGHSLGGLLAIHALTSRPTLFNAYLAASPSLQWDDGITFRQAKSFFASHPEMKASLFFSLANEAAAPSPNPMGENFEQLRKALTAGAPKGLQWAAETYPDEDHGSTPLRAHYAGLRSIFNGWNVDFDRTTGLVGGGMPGLEAHYRELSARFGYPILIPESRLNILGYQLMGMQKVDEAIKVLERNVELYPQSANVYDSLGEAQEAAGKFDAAARNYQKAVQIGTATNDGALPQFKQHVERVAAKEKPAVAPASVPAHN